MSPSRMLDVYPPTTPTVVRYAVIERLCADLGLDPATVTGINIMAGRIIVNLEVSLPTSALREVTDAHPGMIVHGDLEGVRGQVVFAVEERS